MNNHLQSNEKKTFQNSKKCSKKHILKQTYYFEITKHNIYSINKKIFL